LGRESKVRSCNRKVAMVAEAGGIAIVKRGAATKKSLIQDADKEGPETCSKQGHAAIGDGHRLPRQRLSTVS
jgi:hypothetical protein